ncbi:uncharacterized protein B0H18DRAFT_1113377 [Fomitopsis serialis]|uniref:uncharacterized protein n=1 Tax=Fomitopsis serialis TaxID=139415 RepID=UPI002008800D|nr:uncharacterized protein B0H18DRAFT_1113377 [Neoantrodia serialis]KAH9937558.1 hypothetical protein B0H18DRAFT_1113377 [Neoantrodia serialis]
MPTIEEQSGASKHNRAEGGVQEIGLLTPAPSQSKYTSYPQLPRRGIDRSRKDKGKQKAPAGQLDNAATEDYALSGVRSSSESRRPAKRRRTRHTGSADNEHEPDEHLEPQTPNEAEGEKDMYCDAELEASFQLLDVSDVAAVTSIAVDPAIPFAASKGQGSMYVPPAVAHLIEAMNHALTLERTARRRAEERLADELRRRVHAELVADLLAQKNAVLEVETRAWANAAADALAEQFAGELGAPVGAVHSGAPLPSASASQPSPSLVLTGMPGLAAPQGDVLQRAAAVQQFFQQLIPMPVPTQQNTT